MEIYQGLVLGVLQGLTEFLPVSSSGHLVLGRNCFGITESVLSFDISLHVGTMAAVGFVFFRDIKAMIFSLFSLFKCICSGGDCRCLVKNNNDIRLAALIIIASVPTAVIGFLLKPYVETSLSSLYMVGVMLILTGTFLWLTRKIKGNTIKINTFGFKKALFIGLCQGLAVLPGVSRSGATIAGGLFAGIERETAARFSFLLSMPAIIGAELLSLKDTAGFTMDKGTLYGTLAAFAVGFFALKFLLIIVKNGRLHLFAPYCWALGGITLFLELAGLCR
ncbi:MAG: undecaprenyl-diphosphate phosphatase [Desulfobacteraceae bacterium]